MPPSPGSLPAPSPSPAQVIRYNGLCNASAAVALDANRFVVADDNIDTLYTYAFGQPDPVGQLNLTDYLGNRNKDGVPREADLEGSARIGDLIYWIGSHGRNSQGQRKTYRLRFFATPIRDGQVQIPDAPPYTQLLADMLADANLAALGLAAASGGLDAPLGPAPEDPDGFNIEGLAESLDGSLMIGFRNPRPGGLAIVLPLINPAEVVTGQARARFGTPELLPLQGQGIRSLEWIAGRYFIVAGPYGSTDPLKTFTLYTWPGPGTAPVPQSVTFAVPRPESIFARPGSTALQVLSDDGDDCPDPPAFQATAMTLPG